MFRWLTGMLAALMWRVRSFARRIPLSPFELLVLVAIVALLASILLPALQRAMFLAGQAAAARGR